jgi:hypothetical protein
MRDLEFQVQVFLLLMFVHKEVINAFIVK